MQAGIPTLTLHGDKANVAEEIEKFRKLCSRNNLKRGDVLFKLIEAFNNADHSDHSPEFYFMVTRNAVNAKSIKKSIDEYQKLEAVQNVLTQISELPSYKKFDAYCVEKRTKFVSEMDRAIRHYMKSCKHYVNFI